MDKLKIYLLLIIVTTTLFCDGLRIKLKDYVFLGTPIFYGNILFSVLYYKIVVNQQLPSVFILFIFRSRRVRDFYLASNI